MQGSRVQAPGSGPRSELGPKRDAWMLGNCDNGDARALRRITKPKEKNGRKRACGGEGGAEMRRKPRRTTATRTEPNEVCGESDVRTSRELSTAAQTVHI